MALTTSKANDVQDTMMFNNIQAQAQEKLDLVRENLQNLDSRVRTVVKEHPFATVFGVLVGGYFLGRLMARR